MKSFAKSSRKHLCMPKSDRGSSFSVYQNVSTPKTYLRSEDAVYKPVRTPIPSTSSHVFNFPSQKELPHSGSKYSRLKEKYKAVQTENAKLVAILYTKDSQSKILEGQLKKLET